MFRSSGLSQRLPDFVVLTFIITLLGVGVSISRPYLSLFSSNVIHMNPAELGIFMCLNSLGGIVASTWLGKFSDTHSARKTVMLLSAFCSIFGYLSFVFLHNYISLLIVSTLFLGLGSSTYPQVFAYARESASRSMKRDATFAISALRSFFSLAWVIGPLVGAGALGLVGYSGLFTLTAGLFVISFLLIVFKISKRQTSGRESRECQPVSLLTTLKRWEVLAACIAFILANSASQMNGLYMPLLLTKVIHAPEHMVGFVVSLSAALEIPIIIGLGTVAERFGKRLFLLLGCLSGAIYYVGISFANEAWEVLVLQIFCATFISMLVSVGMSYFQEFLPEAPGTATTLFSNTGNIGSLLGSIVGGFIAEFFNFRAVFIVCSVLALISFAFLLRKKRANTPVPVVDVQVGA